MTGTLPAPVSWNTEYGFLVATGYEAVSTVLRNPAVWSSDPRRNPLLPEQFMQLPANVMLFIDPPDHSRLRRLVAPAFSPRAITALRPRVSAIVDACLDGLTGEVELMSDYAYLVPLAVIAELLDVGAEGAELFADLTPELVRMLELDATPTDLSASIDASLEIMMWLTPLLAERKSHPGDDFISGLLSQGDLSVDEVLGMCILLLAAGHETTANLIGNGTYAILRDPDQRGHLLNDPERAVEELLRVEGSVELVGRTAIADTELCGVAVPAGTAVQLQLRRANTDPTHFPDASKLDLSRDPVGHVAFGAGPHFCLGAALSRMESAIALQRLFQEFPDLRLTDEAPRWRNSTTFHALRELPVLLD